MVLFSRWSGLLSWLLFKPILSWAVPSPTWKAPCLYFLLPPNFVSYHYVFLKPNLWHTFESYPFLQNNIHTWYSDGDNHWYLISLPETECKRFCKSSPPLYPRFLQFEFAALPIKGWSRFPHPWNLGRDYPCDYLWLIENDRKGRVPIPSPGLKRPCTLLLGTPLPPVNKPRVGHHLTTWPITSIHQLTSSQKPHMQITPS